MLQREIAKALGVSRRTVRYLLERAARTLRGERGPRGLYHCRRCGEAGHNKRTCRAA